MPSRKLGAGQVALGNLVAFRFVIPNTTKWWQQILQNSLANSNSGPSWRGS